jgi:hypothetical protein
VPVGEGIGRYNSCPEQGSVSVARAIGFFSKCCLTSGLLSARKLFSLLAYKSTRADSCGQIFGWSAAGQRRIPTGNKREWRSIEGSELMIKRPSGAMSYCQFAMRSATIRV